MKRKCELFKKIYIHTHSSALFQTLVVSNPLIWSHQARRVK